MAKKKNSTKASGRRRRPSKAPSKRSRAGGSLQKRGYHHGDLKEALCRAALEIVAEDGPRGVKLAEVCRRAGVSVAAPYRHFADKDALLAMVAERGFAEFAASLERACAKHQVGTLARLEALGRAYVKFAREQPDMFRVMFGAGFSKTDHGDARTVADRALGVFVQTVVECQTAKTLPRGAPEKVGVALWAQVHGLAALLLDADLESMDSDFDETWIPALVHAFVRGLASTKKL